MIKYLSYILKLKTWITKINLCNLTILMMTNIKNLMD